MPLAPRVQTEPSRKTRSSTSSREGKAAKRARERELMPVGPSKPPPSGKYPQLDWATVEDDVVHAADVAGKITQSQLGSNGFYSMTVYVPESYAHAVLDAALAQKGCMAYIRIYTVPIKLFVDAMMEDEDGSNQPES